MTISTSPTPLSYSGDSSTTAFPVTWKYFAKSHVVVTLRSAAGVETLWVLATNYTLTDADVDAGGTLTATVAPATGTTLVIVLEPPNTQTSSLPLGGDFPSTTVEDSLDQAAQRDSKIQNLFDRCFRVPVSDTQSGSELELPIDSLRASKFLAFNASGAPISAAGTSADLGPVTPFVNTLLDDTTGPAVMTTLKDSLAAETSPAMNDELFLYDLSALTVDKVTLQNLFNLLLAANNIFTGTETFVGAIPFVFEGATDNAFETSLAITDPTADRTITVLDADFSIGAATQAEMEAGTILTASVVPGRQQYHPSAAKWWCKCDAAGNINASYNVTSITDDGVGLLTVTIATDFSSISWAAFGMAEYGAGTAGRFVKVRTAVTATAASFRCSDISDAAQDPDYWNVGGFGDQ